MTDAKQSKADAAKFLKERGYRHWLPGNVFTRAYGTEDYQLVIRRSRLRSGRTQSCCGGWSWSRRRSAAAASDRARTGRKTMGLHRLVALAVATAGMAACQGPAEGAFQLWSDGGIIGTGRPDDPLRLAVPDGAFITGSGSAGALPKFTGATTLGTSILSEADGGIGTGSQAPSSLLHVAGQARVDEAVYVRNVVGTQGPANSRNLDLMPGGAQGAVRISSPDYTRTVAQVDWAGNAFFLGGVGVGTTSPAGTLHVQAEDPVLVMRGSNANNGNHWNRISFQNQPGSENAFIAANYIGVGNILQLGTISNGGIQFLTAAIPGAQPQQRMTISDAGNVGIGTMSAQRLLHVRGVDDLARFEGAAYYLDVSNVPGGMRLSTDGTGSLSLRTSTQGGGQLFIAANGNVGIGTGTPAVLLDVIGKGHFSLGVDCGTGCAPMSSRAVKQHIRQLEYDEALAALSSLRPSRYEYRIQPDEPKLGFIAEDVPDLVAMNDRKSLDPMEFAALLTKVVQEQQKEIEAQKRAEAEHQRETGELRRQLAAQQRRLERLEAALARPRK